MKKIRIGTRGSDLALWQANYVAGLLGKDAAEIVIIKTKGDRIQNVSFDKIEGKGFFTKEIEEALLDGRVDLAIHSMKDLPTEETPGLVIAAIPQREDPADVLLVRADRYNAGAVPPLYDGALVGTSSLRRAAQMRHLTDKITLLPLRGNVPTRVQRLREGKFDAVVLAGAGIKRLGIDLEGLAAFAFPFDLFLPAPAQGALALQIRAADTELGEILKKINHHDSELAVKAERFFLRRFGGGCHVPIGALAVVQGTNISLSGVVASVDGKELIRHSVSGSDPKTLGTMLADMLKQEGADRLI